MSEPVWNEPVITVNGRELSTAEAMTVRVAVGSFAMNLEADGLGDDEQGKRMADAYLRCCSMIESRWAKPEASE